MNTLQAQIEKYKTRMRFNIQSYSHELIMVCRNWQRFKGPEHPFSEYVPVIQYYLRCCADIDLTKHKVKIKAVGKKYEILIENQDKAYPAIKVTVSSDGAQWSTYTYKIQTKEEQIEEMKESFPKLCKKYGLSPEHFHKIFKLDGIEYKIVGCEKRKQTFGILCERIDTGRRVGVRTIAVLKALGLSV